MQSEELARKVSHWAKEYGFTGKVSTKKADGAWVIEFQARTTKTRASSMVTRLGLIVQELAGAAHQISTGKQLMSDPPSTREDLGTWRIFAEVPVLRRR